ncbi:lachesin-like isoform X2 [Eriocheir sinensis]|uniref:lachesin-like isoform X2 n=1 Tax=Eriocheir sinensis TaxID=95602 RepID=UPI0021C6FC75|nr:lachesin-like isoform X2 [Eriocheir sinensis]
MGSPQLVILLTLLVLAPEVILKGTHRKPVPLGSLAPPLAGLTKDYYEAGFYYEYEEEPPSFQARSQTFTVEVGQSVIIPCDVDNIGHNKLIIKKFAAHGGKERLLAVGDEKVTRDRRISIERARLVISHARPRDAGTFLCFFDIDPPVQLKHTLDVQFAPTVRSLAPPEQHVPKGTTITLECRAQGNPEPIIRWSRQEGPLPSGLRSEQGQSLTLEGVDRHVEGTYLCTADNGIGESASAAMTITVEYPPEINTEKQVVRTGEGDHVDLVCLVHGRPEPDVTWTRDGHQLPDTDMDTQLYLPDGQDNAHENHLNLIHVAHRHTLTIKNVTERDFGPYMCIAENTHGQKSATIQMTGLPKRPIITSSPIGGESSSYTLTWETESYYPITESLIKYRKAHLGWSSNRTMVMAGAWTEVSQKVKPVKVREGMRYATTHTLQNLEVATDYLTVIRVRNKYGWSAESEHFSFSTKKAMAVLQSTSSSSGQEAISVSMLLLLFSVFSLSRM